jgi:hypothetical protein
MNAFTPATAPKLATAMHTNRPCAARIDATPLTSAPKGCGPQLRARLCAGA